MKEEIEQLIDGGTIEKPVHEDITYEDIHKTQDNLWNFLFFTGYLKVENSISYYDKKEDFYHGITVGLFGGISGYEMQSNREFGNGRPDLVLRPYNPRKPVIIFEFKYRKRFNEMEDGCNEALAQIEEKNYAHPFLEQGYQKIIKYGICFCEKACMVSCVYRNLFLH